MLEGGTTIGATPYYDEEIRRPFASVAASQTDSEIWPAESGKKLRVLSAYAITTAATALTFNRKPAGSGVAISGTFTSADGEPTVNLPYNPNGWFETEVGEGLTVTTGAGGTHAIQVVLASLSSPDSIQDQMRLPLLLADRSPIFAETA